MIEIHQALRLRELARGEGRREARRDALGYDAPGCGAAGISTGAVTSGLRVKSRAVNW